MKRGRVVLCDKLVVGDTTKHETLMMLFKSCHHQLKMWSNYYRDAAVGDEEGCPSLPRLDSRATLMEIYQGRCVLEQRSHTPSRCRHHLLKEAQEVVHTTPPPLQHLHLPKRLEHFVGFNRINNFPPTLHH